MFSTVSPPGFLLSRHAPSITPGGGVSIPPGQPSRPLRSWGVRRAWGCPCGRDSSLSNLDRIPTGLNRSSRPEFLPELSPPPSRVGWRQLGPVPPLPRARWCRQKTPNTPPPETSPARIPVHLTRVPDGLRTVSRRSKPCSARAIKCPPWRIREAPRYPGTRPEAVRNTSKHLPPLERAAMPLERVHGSGGHRTLPRL